MDETQKSELMIAKILSLLMEWGIQESELRFEELDLDDKFRPFFFPCIQWLVSEGVIRTGNLHQFLDGPGAGLVSRPVLTSYGMKILGLTLQLGDQDMPMSTAIAEVSKNGKSYSQVGDFFGGLLGGFTKSVGS